MQILSGAVPRRDFVLIGTDRRGFAPQPSPGDGYNGQVPTAVIGSRPERAGRSPAFAAGFESRPERLAQLGVGRGTAPIGAVAAVRELNSFQ